MSTFFLSPGVFPEELDLSGTNQPITTSIGAIALGARKGTLTRSLFSAPKDFIAEYGYPDPSWGMGHYAALAFLANSQALWVQRVANGAKYAGAVVVNDNSFQPSQTHIIPFPAAGRTNGYASGEQAYTHLIFDAPLITLNSTEITLTLTGPNINLGGGGDPDTLTLTTAPVVYADSNDATLQSIAAAIDDSLSTAMTASIAAIEAQGNAASQTQTFENNGYAGVILANDGTTSGSRIIYVFAPTGVQVAIEGLVTLGASQAAIEADDNTLLFEVYAENPSSDGNLTGISIQNVDAGIFQQIGLTLDVAPLVNQNFQATLVVNGVNTSMPPVPFAPATGSGNTAQTALFNTMNAIGAAIMAAAGGGSFVLANGNLELIYTPPVAGPNYVTFAVPPVFVNTAGSTAALPNVTVSNILTGEASDNTFELWVYRSPNISAPSEKYTVSFLNQVDGNGVQQLIEQVVNNGGGASPTIRVNHNVHGGSALAGVAALAASPIIYLEGGSDGQIPTNGEIITQGWSAFSDREIVSVRILINGGYTAPAVQQYMASIAQNRYDCFAILDMPSDQQATAAALNYRKNLLNINSSYAAIYSPDLLITDQYSNLSLYVPPSGYVAAAFAYNDSVAAEWFAPAGLNRGPIQNVQGVRVLYGSTDTDQLNPAQINPIVLKSGAYTIMGANTLQSKPSALSNINVRRMLITIEVSSVDSLNYQLYEPSDSYTQFLVVQLGNTILAPIKSGRGLKDYLVVSNDANNPSYIQDLGQLNVDYILKPVLPVKFIRLRSVISNQGAQFSEIVGLLDASVTTTST